MPSSGSVAAAIRPAGAEIAATLEQYLAHHPGCVLLENGRVLFDFANAQCSVRETGPGCTLHLWSTTANTVRRVAAVSPRGSALRLSVLRLGQSRPQTWELVPARAVRASGGRGERRQLALRQLQRVLQRAFPDERPAGFRAAMDLQHSFGPAYLRGELVRGRQRTAIVAVGAGESQGTIDGALAVALLWLEHCRERAAAAGAHVGGVRLILPSRTAGTVASRLRWVRADAARLELYTLDAGEESLHRIDPRDAGNGVTHLIRAPDPDSARLRYAASVAAVLELLPPGCHVTGLVTKRDSAEGAQTPDLSGSAPVPATPDAAHRRHRSAPPASPVCEVLLRSPAEVVFLCHGLQFARIRPGFAHGSFRRQDEITVGSGHEETALTPETAHSLRSLVAELFRRRTPGPAIAADPLARTEPEHWLESALRRDLTALDPELASAPVYSQMPALTGEGVSLDRGLLDLLAVTRTGRLAIVEIKAHEDLDLALQGLDYWIRVREHHSARIDPATGLGSLQQQGYFPATRLTPEAPRLYLVAPALHIHPATETILRYLAPEVEWTLVALDERWRTHLRPVWVRRSESTRLPVSASRV